MTLPNGRRMLSLIRKGPITTKRWGQYVMPFEGGKGTGVQPFAYQLKQEGEFPSATEVKDSSVCEKFPVREHDETPSPRNSGLDEEYLSAPLCECFSR